MAVMTDTGAVGAPDREHGTQGRTGRGWAATGVLAGVAGIVGIAGGIAVDAVYDPTLAGDPERIVDRLAEQTTQILVFHVSTMIAALTVLVFSAGLSRRLAAAVPAGSLVPAVARSGLGLVAVAGLMGTGLTTEFVFGVKEDNLLPEAVVVFAHWSGTIAWLWVGAGVSAAAVAVAALRHRAAPRWLGWVSAIFGTALILIGMSPLQYLAGFVGPLWMIVASLAFLLGDRSRP